MGNDSPPNITSLSWRRVPENALMWTSASPASANASSLTPLSWKWSMHSRINSKSSSNQASFIVARMPSLGAVGVLALAALLDKSRKPSKSAASPIEDVVLSSEEREGARLAFLIFILKMFNFYSTNRSAYPDGSFLFKGAHGTDSASSYIIYAGRWLQ